MEEILLYKIALIGVLGLSAQWLAWRFQLPAIVLMLAAGIVAGPVFGWLNPREDFGELLRPIIAIAVCVILFEGGLNLHFKELRDASGPLKRLVFLGVPFGWLFGTLAGKYVAGLSWPVATLFGGILVVTGPTVIVPLLRQARLAQRPAALLKWEGIINDPIGALLAVSIYESLIYHGEDRPILRIGFLLIWSGIASTIVGFLSGRFLIYTFMRGYVPEYLKVPIVLCTVMASYVIGNMVLHEAGLVAVTVMGITMANSRLASLEEIRRFKEYITIFLVSGLFVILTAGLNLEVLTGMDWRIIAFVLVVLFVVRPATIFLSTIGTQLSWGERLLVGWIAPRGVVAVAVSGYFASALTEHGYPDGKYLVPLSFAIVFATVVAHGTTIRKLASWLQLTVTGPAGVLIVGASPWSVKFASILKDIGIGVVVVDTAWNHLREARLAGIPVYYGEILSEHTEYSFDFSRFGYLIAVTDNDAYNALLCTQFAPEFGRDRVFQLASKEEERDPKSVRHSLRGRTLIGDDAGFFDLMRRHYQGWKFYKTRLTPEYTYERHVNQHNGEADLILLQRSNGEISFHSLQLSLKPKEGDVIITYAPSDEKI